MRNQVTVIGKGFSEQQAKVSAYKTLKDSYKNNVLVYGMSGNTLKKEAKLGQQCTTDNRPATEARKWVTKHNIYTPQPDDVTKLAILEKFDSKTDALKKAKELAIKYQTTFYIKVEKELAEGLDPIEAVVIPKGAAEGEWEFTLDIEVL